MQPDKQSETPNISAADIMYPKWWESDWYKEWEKISKRDYHGQ